LHDTKDDDVIYCGLSVIDALVGNPVGHAGCHAKRLATGHSLYKIVQQLTFTMSGNKTLGGNQ
jgi:hypothetical protein